MADDTRNAEESIQEAVLSGWTEPYNNKIISFIIISTASGDDFRLLPQKQDLLKADPEFIESLFQCVKILAKQIDRSVSREAFDKCWKELLLMTRSRNQLLDLIEGGVEPGSLN